MSPLSLSAWILCSAHPVFKHSGDSSGLHIQTPMCFPIAVPALSPKQDIPVDPRPARFLFGSDWTSPDSCTDASLASGDSAVI